ncbi:MAG: hypothetical protein R3E88_10315 [Myxococcota bacterium]
MRADPHRTLLAPRGRMPRDWVGAACFLLGFWAAIELLLPLAGG